GRMAPGVASAENPAKQLATLIGDRVPVIWGAEGIGSVAAMRWKTQMNENGKVPAFAASMSELDHNEVVGWTRPYGSTFSLIAVRHDGEHPEIAARFALSYDIARDAGVEVEEVRAGGRSALARRWPTTSTRMPRSRTRTCRAFRRRGCPDTPAGSCWGGWRACPWRRSSDGSTSTRATGWTSRRCCRGSRASWAPRRWS